MNWTYSLIWINTTKGSNVTLLVHMHLVIINGIFTTMYICIQQRIKFKLANIQTYFESYLLGWFKKNNSIKIIVCWLFRDMNVILLRLVRFNINTAMTSTWYSDKSANDVIIYQYCGGFFCVLQPIFNQVVLT